MTMWLQSHLAKRTQAINTSSLQSQHTMLVFPRSRCNKAVTEQFTPLYAMVINSNTAQSDLYFVANGAVTVAGDILITVPVYPPPPCKLLCTSVSLLRSTNLYFLGPNNSRIVWAFHVSVPWAPRGKWWARRWFAGSCIKKGEVPCGPLGSWCCTSVYYY